ncbi:DNA utilization protein GntX [Corynebacterium atrinae]|uniref:ComF family protein n=1 Tax=Corynebacterium atrinae TaxID=1336740 RepID=UPI0025B60228|nr:ComF family protein [Corynebacterium atrinae]WJY62703.1 DNA utilization protein GntX [Corynebacterium atrinae]
MELFLPRSCAGCQAPGEHLCPECRTRLRQVPRRIVPPVNPHVPVWSLGPYAGPHRGVVLAMKERNNRAVRDLLGPVLAAALTHLQVRGELIDAPVLVPAPTRPRSARLRGGDHVTGVCRASGMPVVVALSHSAGVQDQVGLDAQQRRRNLAGSLVLRQVPVGPVLLVDDVVTTGSTLAASAETLLAAGCQVAGALVLSHA